MHTESCLHLKSHPTSLQMASIMTTLYHAHQRLSEWKQQCPFAKPSKASFDVCNQCEMRVPPTWSSVLSCVMRSSSGRAASASPTSRKMWACCSDLPFALQRLLLGGPCLESHDQPTSTAVACGATEVCDATLLSMRARRVCVRARSTLVFGIDHRGIELLHHRIGDVHPAPAGGDGCVL